jgi:predicted transcriptional regulator
MIAVSLKLPDELAEESKRLASQIGITRTELIRRALQHEMARIKRQQEQADMAASLRAMRQNDAYLEETRLLDEALPDPVPDEPEDWWKA